MGLKKYNRHSGAVIRTRRWKALRIAVLRRDGFKCVECGARGDLEVDHVHPVRTHPELAYEPLNLQTLCVACHSRKTRLEIGLGQIDPRREAWKQLVKELQHA
ncbi:MAG: HNH endonuclease [Hyphomicrobiales bacterium]|nr:MAG: HNH endonuclease [Hyphomicrobiales bacterium]